MNERHLKRVVSQALGKGQKDISAHLMSLGKDKYGGIESVFEQVFLRQVGVKINKRRTCGDIGSYNYMKESERGFVDLVLPQEGVPVSAFEFKAVRMPRKKDCCFDVSQLASDYLRLANAAKVEWGWVVAFVYGPMVDDATSASDLVRRFHNQMFVDYTLSVATGDFGDDWGSKQIVACKNLGWDSPMDRAKNEDYNFAVLAKADVGRKFQAIGAVCLRALGS